MVDTTIINYKMVTYPKEYTLVKIATYNVDIRNTVNIVNSIRNIITYLDQNVRNKNIDIMCIQGVHDYTSSQKLISEIKQYADMNKKTFYFAPELDDSRRSASITQLSQSRSRSKLEKMEIQNLIISEYPIVNSIFSEINSLTHVDDIQGIHTIVGANISICGNLISIYNTTLSWDIKTANINNSERRTKQLYSLFNIIQKNKTSLSEPMYAQYVKTNIHFLVGSLNIVDAYASKGDNVELDQLVLSYRCVDIFRHITEDNGYTNNSGERVDYILFILDDDVNTPADKYFAEFEAIKTSPDLLNYIFKKYKVYFLDSWVVPNTSPNYPVESVFLFHKNLH